MQRTQRTLATLVLCLLGSLALHAQIRPPLDVSITSMESENGKKKATLHIQNNSGKYVAAYTVTLTLHHADGTTSEIGSTLDIGYRATKTGNPKQGIPKLLAAGDSRDDQVVFDDDVVSVDTKLAAVVYADRTAHGDPDSIQEITKSRKRYAERVARENPKDAAAAAGYAKDDLRRKQ